MNSLNSEIGEIVQFDMGQHDKGCGVTITRDYGNCDCNKLELRQAITTLIRQREERLVNEARIDELQAVKAILPELSSYDGKPHPLTQGTHEYLDDRIKALTPEEPLQ